MSVERLTYIKCPHWWGHGRNPTPYSSRETFQTVCDRLGTIEDILGEEYDLERLSELVEADKAGQCVVLPDVDERSRLSMADGLEDVFKEWAYEDKDVGLFGMSDGERKLADAMMKGLKGENNAD